MEWNRKLVRGVGLLAVIAIVGLSGALLGKLAGRRVQTHEALQQRASNTRAILADMQTLQVGQTLPDAMLETLDESPVALHSLLHERTVISVISSGCEGCRDQLDQIVSSLDNPDDQRFFVFVSAGNPRLLRDLWEAYDLTAPLLYDHRRLWSMQLDIQTYPFNIVVDRDLNILDITVGTLMTEDIETIVQANHNPDTLESKS